MSAREWKPGDVAVVEADCWANRKVALRLAEGWAHANGVNVDRDGIVTNPRPLVVIDPEDAEQVERLMNSVLAIVNDRILTRGVRTVQHALREFANPSPPKPPEPKGLGAVVEDRSRERWVRVNTNTGTQEWRCCDYNGEFRRWDAIDAAKVLSEGVTP